MQDARTKHSDKLFACSDACRRGCRILMTLRDIDNSRILERWASSFIARSALDCEKVIPLSMTFTGIGVGGREGGVAGAEGEGESGFGRDLNENFCFCVTFCLSDAMD